MASEGFFTADDAVGYDAEQLAGIVERCRGLTVAQVEALTALPGDHEAPLARKMWEAWLAVHGSGSPLGWGLYKVYRAVEEAAREVGDDLFGWDEEDGVEVLADPAWSDAASAAYHAALSLGAVGYLTPEETATMSSRWTTVFGPLADLPG